jgi:hypothetical protein
MGRHCRFCPGLKPQLHTLSQNATLIHLFEYKEKKKALPGKNHAV